MGKSLQDIPIVGDVMNLLGFETPEVPQAVRDTPAPSLEAEKKPTMPTPDDATVKAAKRRSIAEQRRRRGRASTVLTQQNDEPLGG